jgi:hypothetical protein
VDIAKTEETIREDLTRAIQDVRESHLGERLLGIVLLIVGVFLNTWGNLI